MGDHSYVEERLVPAPEGGDISVIDYGGDGPAVVLMHHRIDYDILAWAAVWWVACFGYWACQALASSAEL